ncbi:unnamed protein product [Arctogadus glacialis]
MNTLSKHDNTASHYIISCTTLMVLNTFANTLQEGEAQHSDLTAIVCLRHFSSNSTSSTVDQEASLMSLTPPSRRSEEERAVGYWRDWLIDVEGMHTLVT